MEPPELQHLTVSLAECKRYHPQTVRKALQQLLEPFNGIGAIVKQGQKVLLKPNLLAAAPPADAVTTHPLVIKVLTEMIQEAGGKVLIGDSPGVDEQEEAHRIGGLHQVIEETGAEMLLFKTTKIVEANGFKVRTIPLTAEIDQADLMINVAKLKTHALTGLTAAVKNTYGCVSGNYKRRFHLEHPLPLDFSRLLLDVCMAVKPAFSIVDAVIAMEGTGPRRGKPRQVGLLMGSPNAVALDSVAAEIAGFLPEQAPTVAAARMLNLPGSDLADINIAGMLLEDCRVSDFDKGPAGSGKVSRLIANFPLAWFRNILYARRPYPFVDNLLCNSCGVCYENCPAQVIKMLNGVPVIDLYNCIRCYCCQELCSQGAIKLDRP
jgi:uncharacterized protein (DUF362 family)/NAD-dependent dihydropyrimidine dehydrogenase PreA subunit